MRSYIAFVTLWHKEGDPSNISNYNFFVTAKDDRRAEKIVEKEVKSYQYWKHTTVLSEDLKTDAEWMRRISTAPHWDKIRSEACVDMLLLNKAKHSKIRAKLEKSGCRCYATSFKELMDHPFNLFTQLAQELSPASKIVIEDGVLYVYDPGKLEKYWETILSKEKEKFFSDMRIVLDRAQKELKHITD